MEVKISIAILGITIILQQVRIMMMQKEINFINRSRKSILRSIDLQNTINNDMCNILGIMMEERKEQ